MIFPFFMLITDMDLLRARRLRERTERQRLRRQLLGIPLLWFGLGAVLWLAVLAITAALCGCGSIIRNTIP